MKQLFNFMISELQDVIDNIRASSALYIVCMLYMLYCIACTIYRAVDTQETVELESLLP